LAHELNNPAAAAGRSAQNLTRLLSDVEGLCCSLLQCVMSQTVDNGVKLKTLCEIASGDHPQLDPLTRSDREQEVGEWLSDHAVPEAWDAAASLVSAGVTLDKLEAVAKRVTAPHLTKVLTWIAKDVEMRLLCRELEQSTGRITETVTAMKSYSYMDRAPSKAPTDLRQGIDTTLTILKHKLKKKSVDVKRDYGDVPPVPAFGGDLNQVWTNLLDNAIDAVPKGGHITIRSAKEGDQAMVEIVDNGPGIPQELREKIFEPFFTTKEVGQGTGLGLDTTYRIIRDHRGDIRFESEPGHTQFRVYLPLN